MPKREDSVHTLLSAITDHDANIYDMTKDLARIAKQTKEDNKEEVGAPRPVIEAIRKVYVSKVTAS